MSGNRNSKTNTSYQPVKQDSDADRYSDSGSDLETEQEENTRSHTNARSSSLIPLEVLDQHLQPRPANPFDPIDEFDLEQAPHASYSQPLEYLYIFSEKEIQELEEQYSRGRYELDGLVKEHKWVYRGFRGENWFSIGTDVSYSLFQIVTSRDGIQSAAKLINKDIEVSNTTGLVLGTPIALVDLAFNLSAVSAAKEAIKSTIEYATRDSYREQVQQFLEKAQEEPGQAAATVVKWAFNKAVLYTHNGIGSAANLIAFYEPIAFTLPGVGDVTIPAWMPLLPAGAQAGIIASFAYGGNRYYSLFSNPDYYQNLDKFWIQGVKDLWNHNPDGSPWLLGELYRGKVFTPLQIAIQGLISTVAIRAYPNFYYIAEETFSKLLGLNPSTTAALAVATAVIVAWHTLCAH